MVTQTTPFRIDESLREFIELGLAVQIATASNNGSPHVTYGWSPRVPTDGRTVEVFIDKVRSATPLADLKTNKKIAMTVADPISYRSIQLKGTVVGIELDCADDQVWVRNGREGFLVRTSLIGDDPVAIRNLWYDDVVRLTFSVEFAFDQTPGPEAGRPL